MSPSKNMQIIQMDSTKTQDTPYDYDSVGTYVFYMLVYIISFVLIRETPSLELFGFIIFLTINFIYNTNLLYDLFSYFSNTAGTTSFKLTNWQIFNFAVIVITVVLNVTSSIINGITLNRLYTKYTDTTPMKNDPKLQGIRPNLNPTNKKHLNDIEIIFICIVCMTAATTLNIYFEPKALLTAMYSLISGIYTSVFGDIVRMVFPFLLFIIGAILIDRLRRCHGVSELYKNTQLSYGFFLATCVIYFLRIIFDYTVLKKYTRDIYWADSIFDILKWLFSGLSILYAGFSIKEYDILAKMVRLNKCFSKGLPFYFISFAVLIVVLYAFTTINPNYLTKAIYYSITYIIPIVLLGLVSYLVYLSDDLAKLVRHEFIK